MASLEPLPKTPLKKKEMPMYYKFIIRILIGLYKHLKILLEY